MRTVFVNPSRRTRRKSRKVTRRAAPRKRRASRRRNAGIAPFIGRNPMILANPHKVSRRRRRSNPSMPTLKQAAMTTLHYGAGSGIGAALNIFVIRHIKNDWLRHSVRILGALGGGMFLPDKMGGAMAGATLYPSLAELAIYAGVAGTADVQADLNELAADLEDALDDEDDSDTLYVP